MIVANNFQEATDAVTKINESRDKVLREIEKSLKESGVQVTIDIEQGVLRLPEDILFEFGRYEVNDKGKKALKTLSDVLGKFLPCISIVDNQSHQD